MLASSRDVMAQKIVEEIPVDNEEIRVDGIWSVRLHGQSAC